MKKSLLLIPIFLVAGVALFLLSSVDNITGNVLLSEKYESNYPFSAAVEIEETGKQRTHMFTVYSDGVKTLLKGNFRINNKDYPGMILYDGEKSYLFRSDPNQAIFYGEPAKLIYGFVPINYFDSIDSTNYEVTILEKDSQGFPLKYNVFDKATGETSTITLKNLLHSPKAISEIDFTLPDGTEYRNAEGVLKVQ